MKIIDSDDYAASGIETFFFPGGEPHARIPKNFGDCLLDLKARTWNDIGIALVVLDALVHQDTDANTEVFFRYYPGGRQDRTDGQTPFTAKMIHNLFATYATAGYTFDAHSDVTGQHVMHNYMPSDLNLKQYFTPDVRIIIPDEGATERCNNFAQAIGSIHYPLIQCKKKRNFETGKFEGFEMPPLPGPGTYLIVDDICDGGGTFNLLAQEFEKNSCANESTLALWVSHGIFSRGMGNLHGKISKIYTTDSWCKLDYSDINSRLQKLTLDPILNQIMENYK